MALQPCSIRSKRSNRSFIVRYQGSRYGNTYQCVQTIHWIFSSKRFSLRQNGPKRWRSIQSATSLWGWVCASVWTFMCAYVCAERESVCTCANEYMCAESVCHSSKVHSECIESMRVICGKSTNVLPSEWFDKQTHGSSTQPTTNNHCTQCVRVFTCSACGAKGSCSLPPLESELLERWQMVNVYEPHTSGKL